MSDEQ
jgi:uncharacterized UBP type Zn finger protein